MLGDRYFGARQRLFWRKGTAQECRAAVNRGAKPRSPKYTVCLVTGHREGEGDDPGALAHEHHTIQMK